jgi:23S rRNA (guanosine2251-2'-O)-methyltransferase
MRSRPDKSGKRLIAHDRSARPPESLDRESPRIIYGVLPVVEALRASVRRIDRVLIAEGAKEARLSSIFDLCRERSIPWVKTPASQIARFAGPDVNHQGVIAVVSAAVYSDVDEILASAQDTPLILILDGIEDPRNLGAILRVADGAGVDGVVIPERRAVGLTDTVAKSSAGAVEHVKVAKTPNLNRLIQSLKKEDIWIVGTTVEATLSYTQWDWTKPSALVLGGEGSGLHRLVAENCDILVKIPMFGHVNSLNVSVAAGVVLFEAQRQRGGDS